MSTQVRIMVESPHGSHGIVYRGSHFEVKASGADLYDVAVRDAEGGTVVGAVALRGIPFYVFTEPVPEPEPSDWDVTVKVDDQPGRTF